MAERGGHDAGGGARLPPGAEQRAQLLGRLWWAGPTPADGELLCSAAAATLGGGSTFHAEKLESCEKKTSPRRVGGWGGGTAKRIAGERRERKCDESGFYALYAAASVTIHVTFRNSFVLS